MREGLKLDPQTQLVPVWGADTDRDPLLLEALAEHGRAWTSATSSGTTWCSPTRSRPRPPASTAAGSSGPRLDNLGSCHSAVTALVDAAPARHTQLLVANDHEEVGSGSMEGARGQLPGGRARPARGAATGGTDPQDLPVTVARSRLVSADMAHAQHPTQGERHEP